MDGRRYLYHARISSHLTLEQIGVRTALSPVVLRDLDEGRFERLPAGLYARSYVRAFADAVGLDPEDALDQVGHLLPGAPDPLPVLHAKEETVGDRFGVRVQRIVSAISSRAGTAGLHWVSTPDIARFGAATIDALVLLVISSLAVCSSARLVGLSIDEFLRQAGLPLAAFCAIPMFLYFAIFEGAGRPTLGQALLSHSQRRFQAECSVALKAILGITPTAE